MKIGIVTPVVLQNEALLTMTLEAVEHMKTRYAATLYVVCNRLHVCVPEALQALLQQRFRGRVQVVHEPGVERSVAGAWNVGCLRAMKDGADYIAIVANDTRLNEECLDLLADYGASGEADLWSAISYNGRGAIDASQRTDGADFSCFMFVPGTIGRHGFFDPNFRPAYFEDNDYYARVVLGGGDCRIVHAAQFFHHGSMTVKSDPEMAHHVSHWFEQNRGYFRTKWGVSVPENSKEGVAQRYYHHPFNDRTKALSWFPSDGRPA